VGVAGFWGAFTMTIDDKGRLTIPSSFRKTLDEQIVVRWNKDDGTVEIFSAEGWENFYQHIMSLPFLDSRAQYIRTMVGANAFNVSIDKQGRVLIPGEFKERAGIQGGQAIVTGAMDRVKVWSPETWAAAKSMWETEDFIHDVGSK
jgi:MraZ protein